MGQAHVELTGYRNETITEAEPASGPQPTITALHHLLANPRRRYVIASLQASEEPLEIGTLAEGLVAWEEGVPVAEVRSHQRKTGYTALQQRHLPKLDDAGLIDFDKRSGTVRANALLEEVDIYTEIVREGDFPWSYYYLGLAGVVTAILAGRWAGIIPEVLHTELAWGIFATFAFGVSAVVHIYHTKRSALETLAEELEGVQ